MHFSVDSREMLHEKLERTRGFSIWGLKPFQGSQNESEGSRDYLQGQKEGILLTTTNSADQFISQLTEN